MGLRKLLKKLGLHFSVTLPWPGEKGMGKPMPKDKKVDKQEIMKQIRKGG